MTVAPGPWTAINLSDGTVDVDASDDSLVCRIQQVGTSAEDTAANARLIAAAPDLLRACKMLLTLSLPHDVSGSRMVEEARKICRDAQGDYEEVSR